MNTQQLRYLLNSKRILDSHSVTDNFDLFVSAFNGNTRVQETFVKIQAREKYWLIFPEYDFLPIHFPTNGNLLQTNERHEAESIRDLIQQIGDNLKSSDRICFDITGFLRPHILFLMRYLQVLNIKSFSMIYTEPLQYRKKANTDFSIGDVQGVRQVAGYEGSHDADLSNDVLILGLGYDHNLISHVVTSKEGARIIQLRSLPSLSADMYQESILRLDRASLASRPVGINTLFFASANDPFVTASELSSAYALINAEKPITNLYLSPLATKAQTVGFGLFYLTEMTGVSASIIFPFAEKYTQESSKGVARSWIYDIVLP